MSQAITPKAVRMAVITSMTLGEKTELDAARQAALDQAFDVLDQYSGSTVAAAFVEWQRGSQLRRDPCGPSTRITDELSSPPPNRSPFRTRSF